MTIPVINQGSLSLATRNADAFSNIAGGNLAQNSQTTVYSPWESFGAKLRRLARDADISNSVINPPWTVPAAWVATTAYVIGDVRSNAGGWYACQVAGTSAGSGGPTSTTTGLVIADGSVQWTYIGGPTISASDALAPALTYTTGTPAGLSHYVNCILYPTLFRIYGGYATTFATNYWSINAFNQAAASPVSFGSSIGFNTDAPKFAIGFTSSSPDVVRVIIDGRYYSPSAILPTSGATPTWAVFDFSSTSGRRKRSVIVDGPKSNNFNFAGVRIDNQSQVWAPDVQDDVRAVFIGDSLFVGSGYGPLQPGNQVPRNVGRLLGWSDCWNFGVGGTGYINPGTGPYYTYGQRITEALTLTPDVWVFMGSTNDTTSSAAAIKAAALAAFQAIRTGGSASPIIVFGVWPLNDANVSTIEGAVQAAVTQFADPLGRTYFIPLYADAVLPWITGSWNNTADTSSNNQAMYISNDGTHPPDIGTLYLSQRMARAIRTTVLPSSGLSFSRTP